MAPFGRIRATGRRQRPTSSPLGISPSSLPLMVGTEDVVDSSSGESDWREKIGEEIPVGEAAFNLAARLEER